MFKELLVAGFSVFAAGVAQAALGTYDFAGADPGGDAAVPTLSGMTFGAFSRVNVTFDSKNGTFSSSAWNTGSSIDTAEYVEFILTPDGSHILQLQNITFDNSRSGGGSPGPTSGQVEIFLGAGLTSKGSQTFSPTSGTAPVTFDFTDFDTGFAEAVTIRFYGWNSSGAAGLLEFDNVAINGVLAIPEPINVALAVFGLAFCGIKFGRRLFRAARA